MRRFAAVLPLLCATACNPAGGLDGVWILYLDPPESSEGSTITSENFNGGGFPTQDTGDTKSPWTVDNTIEQSEVILTLQIVGGPKDEAFLFQGPSVVPGIKDGDTWTFEWDEYTEDTTTETHESGYSYEEFTRDSVLQRITMTLESKQMATGDYDIESSSLMRFTESDEWDEKAVKMYPGQIPASTYLVPDKKGKFLQNVADLPDCESSPCEISIENVSSTETTYTATLTDWDASDYENVPSAAPGGP